ncbi:NAD(P)H-dependent glycerol-3-phosphate dehydrogenase [Albirhodobacter sp. R86504]|uniref:NAD(P)H-dependent glycerol-3-phosphate dehydrogenase n=1 Tax=Albirhodobacter sp. R86504 TaxID=3093848 RepID=UPI003672E75D
MTVAVIGAGAFGTALAVALSANGPVALWARDAQAADRMQRTRENSARLEGITIPQNVTVTADLHDLEGRETVLLAMPMQQMSGFLEIHRDLFLTKRLIACSKGIDIASGQGPTGIIRSKCPKAVPAILTGPSFAADIARGLPTALTLACEDVNAGEGLQRALSTPVLRLYRSEDVIGAELGGALKNVIAIAAGVVIGAGLGDSARAAIMTRGFSEMRRVALLRGARVETLNGLSGLGDLVLTCTSQQSRNFRFGHALGRGEDFDPSLTVEGAATAKAVSNLAETHQIDLPIATMVAALVDQKITVEAAVSALMSRPLKEE